MMGTNALYVGFTTKADPLDLKYLPARRAPSNWKDEVKIAEYEAAATAKQLAEAKDDPLIGRLDTVCMLGRNPENPNDLMKFNIGNDPRTMADLVSNADFVVGLQVVDFLDLLFRSLCDQAAQAKAPFVKVFPAAYLAIKRSRMTKRPYFPSTITRLNEPFTPIDPVELIGGPLAAENPLGLCAQYGYNPQRYAANAAGKADLAVFLGGILFD